METVLKFDRVVLTKEFNDKIKKVGEVFEVADILDNDKSFLLRDVKTKIILGIVSFDDFEKYFVKEGTVSGWTPWTPITGFNGQTDVLYRTNHKKVQVKFLTDKVRAESCCNKADEFNLYFGVQIAYVRCYNKALLKKKEQLEKELKKIDIEFMDNEKFVQTMINSLEV